MMAAAPQSAYRNVQLRTFKILEGDVSEPATRFCEIFIALLVVLNVVAIILESVPDIHAEWGYYFHYFDVFSVVVFSIEYVLRVWSYAQKFAHEEGSAWQGRKSYIFSFYGLVDFLSTVPFYLQLLFPGTDLRVLRMFRLLRIFKLSRYNSAMDDMFEAIKSERDSFSSALFLLFISSLLFSSLIYIIEGHEQPEVFPSIPAAMHWFFITIISGWGNVDPVTYAGVGLVIITQILAIALAAILTGVVSTAYTAQVSRREALYEMEIREALADGVVTKEEEANLLALQTKYGMSDEQVAAIAAQVRIEQKTASEQ
jgi:voltage-gated potassium channel